MLLEYLPEFLSILVISFVAAVSPGADFFVVMRNSLCYGRRAGLISAIGVGCAIWVHVAYTILGLALIIANSIFAFTVIKYLGAAYLIYLGWHSLRSTEKLDAIDTPEVTTESAISDFRAFKSGFITNALNPKATLFFLSIFTQVVSHDTPLWVQLVCGGITSMTAGLWFCFVATVLTQAVMFKKFSEYKQLIERCIGTVLIGLGIKVAISVQP